MSEMYLEGLEARHAARQRHANNSARHAFSFHRLETTGWGQIEFDEVLRFDLSFTQRPFMAYGYYVESDALVEHGYPHCAGLVTEWDQDARGLYIGAWVAVSIQLGVANYPLSQDVAQEDWPAYVIEHDFTFQAVAIKDLPLDVEEQ